MEQEEAVAKLVMAQQEEEAKLVNAQEEEVEKLVNAQMEALERREEARKEAAKPERVDLELEDALGTTFHFQGVCKKLETKEAINEFDELTPNDVKQAMITGKITTVRPDGTSQELEGVFSGGQLQSGVATNKKAKGSQVCTGEFKNGELVKGTIVEEMKNGNVCTQNWHTGTFLKGLLSGEPCESKTRLSVDGILVWSSNASGKFVAGVLDLNSGITYRCEGPVNPIWKAVVDKTVGILNTQVEKYGGVTKHLSELPCPTEITIQGPNLLFRSKPCHLQLVTLSYSPTEPFAADSRTVRGVATAIFDLVAGTVTFVGAPGSADTAPAPAREGCRGSRLLGLFGTLMGDGDRVIKPLGADAAVLKAVCVDGSRAVDKLEVAAAYVVYHNDGTVSRYGC